MVKEMKDITVNIGFCTLFTTVGIIKVLFKLMQQVVLKENFK